MCNHNFPGLAVQGWLEIFRRLLMFCECVVLQFICCIANTDPEAIVHSLPVNYASFINQ